MAHPVYKRFFNFKIVVYHICTGQLNLAHIAKNKKYQKTKLKQTNASATSPIQVQYP